MTRTPQRAREDGAAVVEVALIVPALVVLLLFIVFVGRLGTVQQDVYAATRDGSRAASLRHSVPAAVDDARRTVAATLAGRGLACGRLQVTVDTSRFVSGGTVAVATTCVVSLSDVSSIGVPGAKTITARAVAVIDRYRSEQ